MNWQEYEELLSQLVAAIHELAEGVKPEQVKWGRKNRWEGVSGYKKHQIDVSAHGPRDIILAECKYWTRPVSIAEVMTFFARIQDIQPLWNAKIHGAVATTVKFYPGAILFGRAHNIDLATVRSAREFVLTYKHFKSIGVFDQGYASESATVERRCATCGTELLLRADSVTFFCPNCNR